jgi:hypothetical protein
MRFFVHLRNTTEKDVAAFLHRTYTHQKGPPWAYLVGGEVAIYLDCYNAAPSQFSHEEWVTLVEALGSLPAVTVSAHVTARHVGNREAVPAIVSALLGAFQGVAQDESSDKWWTAQQVLSAYQGEGRPYPGFPPLAWEALYTFLVYMDLPAVALLIDRATPFRARHVCDFATAQAEARSGAYSAVFARSPMAESGGAAEVIRTFRRFNPNGLTIYKSWDCRVELSGMVAARCAADFLLVDGVLSHELVNFVPYAVEAKRKGLVPSPPTFLWYESVLRQYFPTSPCWATADGFRQSGKPPSEYE